MTITADRIRIPVYNFELSDYEEDNRFKKVKIWIAHSGENLNGTSFSVDTLEKMIPTLSYVPIVGYVEKDNDEDDFSDHRQRIVLKDGDIEKVYLGQAYGFIPEDPNAQIEYREGKEWLTAEGYLWTKWQDSVDIIGSSNGSKSHSMEIIDINGYVDDYGVVNVTSARFSGLCVLGDKVAPAMTGSTIEFFSANSFENDLKQMIYEFSQKGVSENLDIKLKKDLENQEDLANKTEPVVEDPKEPETTVVEDGTEDFNQEEPEPENGEGENGEQTDVSEPVQTENPEVDENYTLTFSYSFEDIRSKLYDNVKGSLNGGYAYIVETYKDSFVYSHETYNDDFDYETKYYKATYSLDGERVVIGDKTEVLSMFVTSDEKTTIEENRSRIEELTAELKELQEFKAQLDQHEKEEVLKSHSEKLTEEEFSLLSEQIDTYTVVELEKEIAFSIFKRSDDEKDSTSGSFVQSYSMKNTSGRYGDLDRFFTKK